MLPSLLLATALAGPVADGADQYAAGDFAAAEQIWEEAGGERPSATVLYDLGLARYQQGDLPGAVAAWRRGRALAPRDGELTHNLAQARGELAGLPAPVGSPAVWMEILTPVELGLLALLLLLAGGVGASGRLGGSRRAWGLAWVVGAGLGGLAGYGAWLQAAHPVGVLLEDAVLRQLPDPLSTEAGTLPAGAEVAVLAHVGPFVRVQSGEDDVGWVVDGLLER